MLSGCTTKEQEERKRAKAKAYYKTHKEELNSYNRDYKKEWAKVHPGKNCEHNRTYVNKYPEKLKAHRLIAVAINNGSVKRLSCEICGNPDSEAHHDDYSKPLNVRWLCIKHHGEYHARVRNAH